jgi:hypothetical protein
MQSRFCRMRIGLWAGLILLASCFCTHLFAQSASVSGQVLDASGAAVKGAAITLLSTATQVTVSTASDDKGIFLLPPVAPGQYQVTVTANGYATWVESGITLEVGEKDELNPVLAVGSVSQTVEVTSVAPEIATEDTDKSTVTEPSLVANIPLDVRNPLQ